MDTTNYKPTRGGGGGADAVAAAPFVLKTYRMVNDISTDSVIAWGRDNNSFVVVDPFAFSQSLLPAYFKHCNFSSFVRQLNTYGFRKVDPDQWEFAHTSFLKGQTQLLSRIVRRTSPSTAKKKEGIESSTAPSVEDDDDWRVAAEVVRLKEEQKKIQERVQGMSLRLEESERKPKQMMAFLLKLAGNPDLIRRLVGPESTDEYPVRETRTKRPRIRSSLDAGNHQELSILTGDHDECWYGREEETMFVGNEEEDEVLMRTGDCNYDYNYGDYNNSGSNYITTSSSNSGVLGCSGNEFGVPSYAFTSAVKTGF